MSTQEQTAPDLWKELLALAKSKRALIEEFPGTLTGHWVRVRHNGGGKEGYDHGQSFRAETRQNAILSAKMYLEGLPDYHGE